MPKRELSHHDYAAVERYALANNSDPFAKMRALNDLRTGLAEAGDYDAEAYDVTRQTADGRDFRATAYKNVKRA